MRCRFFVQLTTFMIGKSWSSLQPLFNFFPLWVCLFPTLFLFVDLFHLYSLSLFLFGQGHLCYMWAATHFLQFFSRTVTLNFDWLSHKCPALLLEVHPPLFFPFKTYIIFTLCRLPHIFSSFSGWNCSTCPCVNVTQIYFESRIHFVYICVVYHTFFASSFPCVNCHIFLSFFQ